MDNPHLFQQKTMNHDGLQIILDNMKEAVILINAAGQISLANPRVERLLGLKPQQILNRPIKALIKDADLELASRLGFTNGALLNVVDNLRKGHWEDTLRDNKRITFQIQMGKNRFIDRTDSSIRDENGQAVGLLMVFTDVTEARELAQAREDLSSMIVHDLRGPLTAIMTSLGFLDEIVPLDNPLRPAVQQTAEVSLRATRKLLNLVDSLLDISKLESGVIVLDREPMQLGPLCSHVMDELKPVAKAMEVNLTANIPDQLPILSVDTDKIERVLLNLVDNAIKFTPAGGEVNITAYPEPDSAFVRVEVCDTGTGIPDEYKNQLFDRYVQLNGQKGRRRGTGLGLTFCRMAVEAHGGRIWIEDNPAGGAVFNFTLPVADMDYFE